MDFCFLGFYFLANFCVYAVVVDSTMWWWIALNIYLL